MTVQQCWAPKLKSVKFEFDTQQSGGPDEAHAAAQHVVIESPFEFDVPGVPRTVRIRPSQPVGPLTISGSGVADHEATVGQAGPVSLQHARAAPHEYVVGGSCVISSPAPPSQIDLAATVSTAWALLLSHQVHGPDTTFALSLSETGFEPFPVSVSMRPEKLVSHVQGGLAARFSQLERLSSGATCRRGPYSGGQAVTALHSALEFRSMGTTAAQDRHDYSDYHLVLVCSSQSSGTDVALSAWFDSRHMERKLVQYLLSDLEHVLWQLLGPEASQVRLDELETVGPLTRRAMIRLNRPLNRTSEIPFHHEVALHVAMRPESRAIDAWDGALTYAELGALSDGLANRLVELGIGRESFVPVVFEKSKLGIIAMLAVVKAGGAIVPMDPAAPLARLQAMAKDTSAPLAICSAANRGKLASVTKELVLDMGLLGRLSAAQIHRSISQAPAVSPEDALYVIFTSGSTGRPKGVVVTHGAFSSAAAAFKDPILVSSPNRRVLHYASPSFDVSILETFVPLTVGGCICIPSDSARLDDLAQCINDLEVNWAVLTPQVAGLLHPDQVPGLEVLCLGGEALPRDLADTWAEHVTLINGYGPSEAAIMCVTSEPIQSHQATISIGRPRGCAVWIVNESGRGLQSFNAVGEIVLEGAMVARGYLGDDEKTAASFSGGESFLGSIAPLSRFYRTGDLGRLNVDGTIDFFGRKDGQVKINGQRVELGEIEHHMKRALHFRGSSSMLDVVVEPVQPSGGGQVMLAAFIGPKEGPSSEPVLLGAQSPVGINICKKAMDLQDSLSQQLPKHMIPKVVFPCARIPRSPSGKADRKRLREAGSGLSPEELCAFQRLSHKSPNLGKGGRPFCRFESQDLTFMDDDSPDGSATSSTDTVPAQGSCSSGFSTPSTELSPSELLLRGIWAHILHLPEESILPGDDFFKLGGDSIGLIKVVAACRKKDTHVTVAAIADQTILNDMARACRLMDGGIEAHPTAGMDISRLMPEGYASSRKEAATQCGLRPDCIEDMYPCTHMQEELAVADMMHPGVSIGRFIHRLSVGIDLARFRAAWERIWEGSPVLRTRFVNTALAGSLQAVVRQEIPWTRAQGLQAYLEADGASLMPPGSCLARFAVIDDGDDTIYFVWTMHHMLYDGWSIPLICQRFNAVYHGIDVEPVADFRMFVAYSKSLDRERTVAYWTKVLDHVAPSTFPAPASGQATRLAQSRYKASLELPTTAKLLQTSGLTLSTVVQAAWALMIGSCCKTDDVLFGVTVSGRNAALVDIEKLDGPTLATVPVRLRPRSGIPAIDFLRSVQGHMKALIPHEQTGLKNIGSINSHTKRGCEFQNVLIVQAGAAWDRNEEPLSEPLHAGEDATLPLLCQVWLLPGTAKFDVVFDASILRAEAVEDAISAVQVAIMQLLDLTNSSTKMLDEIKLCEEATANPPPLEAQAVDAVNPVDETIHGIISVMATNQGHVEALCSSQDSLSYHALLGHSTRLAMHLMSLGVCRGETVPLCFEKSIWTVVAMLAVLKSGAAFVLLDPTQPKQRLQKIVAQVDAQFAILSPGQEEVVDFDFPMRCVVLSSDFMAALPLETAAHQLPRVSPGDLAYMIFTSGSTGEPKGVMINHLALTSSAAAYGEALQLGSARRVLQFSSYCFDASINETLVVLMRGSTVCVASEKERIEELAGFIRRTNVDWAILTPSVARILSPTDVPCLETLDLGGEAPDQALLSKWHRAGVLVFNVYGPAEAAGTAFCQHYREGLDPRAIGSPMGCRAWIVNADNHDELTDDGYVGELLLEGPILARGYLKDHRKTTRSFILDPKWALRPNSSSGPRRMYKTGDLCFRNKGVMVFVGRKDLQVKVHGQRVEIGDIEAHLATCDGIQRCAVFYPVEGPFKQELTAVIELQRDGLACEIPLSSLRRQLSTKIPAAMVPTRWVNATKILGEGRSFPLSASGKVDRRLLETKLKEVSGDGAEVGGFSAHGDATYPSECSQISAEEQPAHRLAEAIHAMLPVNKGVESPGPGNEKRHEHKKFDDLVLQSCGLDSLKMMSLMYLISRQFNATVSLQILMEKTTTIRKLAKAVSEAQSCGRAEKEATLGLATVDIMGEIDRHDSVVSALEQQQMMRLASRAGEAEDKPKTRVGKPLTVLLTGASGFVGTQILRQLLESALVGKVVAVVRGADESAAKKRTIDASIKARWWTDLHQEKLEVWRGDLSLGRLGLGSQQWDYLESGSVDAIIHNGAVVNWTASFASLEATNIGSTVELLSLAVKSPRTRFVYITGGRDRGSEDAGEGGVARELSAPGANGYSQSKFVAEAVVRRAALRCNSKREAKGGRFTIVSPGLVIGTPTEGVANSDDYIWRLAAACIRAGAYNGDQEDDWVDVCDATWLAATIADAALGVGGDRDGADAGVAVVRDVRDGMTWGEFWGLVAGAGYRLEARSASDWLAAVRRDMEQCRESHPLWPLAHLVESQARSQAAGQRGETPFRLRVAVRRNVAFLAEAGFLPQPAGGGAEREAAQGGCFSRTGLGQ